MNYNNAQFEKAFGTFGQLPPSDMPEICFSGRSNVGKSSLINKIIGRKSMARVSSKPGKTITINFYKVDNLRLVDLPGYGYAKIAFSEKERWADLMEGYFSSDRNIRMVFQLIDMRHPATEFDISMLHFLKDAGIPFMVILTKSDKLNKTETNKRLELIVEELSSVGDNITILPFTINSEADCLNLREIIDNLVD